MDNDDASLGQKRKQQKSPELELYKDGLSYEGIQTKRKYVPVNSNNGVKIQDSSVGHDSIPPHEKALAFGHVLASIFRNLSVDTLKICRQVSTDWNEEATRALLQNHLTTSINWSYEGSVGNYLGEKTEPSAHFVSNLETSQLNLKPPIPVNCLSICTDNLYDDPLLQTFLSIHGKHIRSLSVIGDTRKPTSICKFETLIALQLPNLKYLTIYNMPKEWNNAEATSSFLKGLILPKLTHFEGKCVGHDRFLRCIINAAVSLRRVDTNHRFCSDEASSDCLRLFCEPSKIGLLQKFCFVGLELDRGRRIEVYEALAGMGCKFTFLNLTDLHFDTEDQLAFKNRFVRCVNVSLESSAETLEEIRNFNSLLWLSRPDDYNSNLVQIPLLPKLKDILKFRIDFSDRDGGSRHILDRFPNLVGIRDFRCTYYTGGESIGSASGGERCIEMSANERPHLSLKTLVFVRRTWVNARNLRYFSEKFPNLTRASFPRISNFLHASKFIWRLEQVQFLEMSFCLNETVNAARNGNSNAFPDFDAGFTGFSIETCFELELPKKCGHRDIEALRVYPSILKLKHLKKLLVVIDLDFESLPWDGSPLLTQVTGNYAFRMLSDLHVTVDIVSYHKESIKKGLVGIMPFIHSIN